MKNFVQGETAPHRLMKELLKLNLGDFTQAYIDRKRDHSELQVLTTDLAFGYYSKRRPYNKDIDMRMA